MVKDTEENRKKCLCPKCPSYPKNCEGELLFCGLGKSTCDITARGCLCPTCPVYFENNLKELYYCDKDIVGENKIFMRKKGSKESGEFYQTIVDIKNLAETGESKVCSMGSLKKMPFSFLDLHFVPAQIDKIPLNREDKVDIEVVIGPNAQKPLKVSSPIMISGMSFGATSKNVRLVISQTAGKLKIGFNSGEGGILKEELNTASDCLIGQYSTGRFGINEEIIKKVAAVEIRFGQGAYPGKGSYLPAKKMIPEVAKVRGLKEKEPAYSPAHHHDIKTPGELKQKVSWLRKVTGGVPIGAKIGCGNLEKDLSVLIESGVDFIALDGFGGATGATDFFTRENVGIPILAALPRAAQFLKDQGVKDKISLIAGGGLRNSADFAKCLALGADAVYIGTAALIAINCEQYRICYSGLCPTGVTTHSSELLKQLDIEKGIKKLTNFIEASTREIADFTRIVGRNDISKLSSDDLVSIHRDLARLTKTRWINGELIK